MKFFFTSQHLVVNSLYKSTKKKILRHKQGKNKTKIWSSEESHGLYNEATKLSENFVRKISHSKMCNKEKFIQFNPELKSVPDVGEVIVKKSVDFLTKHDQTSGISFRRRVNVGKN